MGTLNHQAENQPPCPRCGKSLLPGAGFCTHCGAGIGPPEAAPAASRSATVSPPASGRLNVGGLVKGLARSLATSALLMAPGLALLLFDFLFTGMVLLFLASFWMMARTYRRPWRLTALSCLIPPVVASISYGMQLVLFSEAGLPWLALAASIGAGILLGWWRGTAHRVYSESGALFARRTFGYLLCWVLGYGFTQALSTTASSVWMIHGGLVTGAFTTALLVMVSLVLLRKRRPLVAGPPGGETAGVLLALLCFGAGLLAVPYAHAQHHAPGATDLHAALTSGDAEEIFAAALISGLNRDLRLTRIRRAADQSDARRLNDFMGIRLDHSQFAARSDGDHLKIIFNTGRPDSPPARYLLKAFGPLALDKLREWVMDPDQWEDDVRFADDMTFRPVRIGDYAMVLSGSNERVSLANGILLSGDRVVLVELTMHRGGQGARLDRMMLDTLAFMAGISGTGPGGFIPHRGGAAAVSIATLLMLASAGIALQLVQSVAAASGLALQTTAESASRSMTDAAAPRPAPAAPDRPPPLIDPRDGKALESDGDRVYWDDDDGWIDRQTAERWIQEIHEERARRDDEVERRWGEIEESRDDYYDQQQADLRENGFRWNAERQMWVDMDGDDYPIHLLHSVYGAQDYIDDNIDRLPPKLRQRVNDQLARIDTSDPYNIPPEDLERLGRLAGAVRDLRYGQDESAAAARMHAELDRRQTSTFLKTFGWGVARFGLSRLDPTQGVATGAVFGYVFAPEGRGVTNAVIGGLATYADVSASAMAPSNMLWNVATGSSIAAAEMAAYGGSWADIKRSALIGGGMNGLSALGQKPGVRSWLDGTPSRGTVDVETAPRARPAMTDDGPPAASRAPVVDDDGRSPTARSSAADEGAVRSPDQDVDARYARSSEEHTGAPLPPDDVAPSAPLRSAPAAGDDVAASRPSTVTSADDGTSVRPAPGEDGATVRPAATDDGASDPSISRSPASPGEPLPPRTIPEFEFPDLARSHDLDDFANGGQARLALAEERGQVTVDQAQHLTARGTAAVDEAVQQSAPQAMSRFEAETGVRIKKAYVGDSGSSATEGPRSVDSDNDRTIHADFEELDLLHYAKHRFPDARPEVALANAHAELTHKFAGHQRQGVDAYLHRRYDVSTADLGVDVYGGVAAPGPGAPTDLYGPAFTRMRQSVRGKTTVFNRDGSSYQTSGQALVDAEHMARDHYQRADHPMTGDDTLQRMTGTDYRATASQQVSKAQHIDPLDHDRAQVRQAAKSLERADQASRGLGGPPMDARLLEVAKRIQSEPQFIPEILAEARITREQFLSATRADILRLEPLL